MVLVSNVERISDDQDNNYNESDCVDLCCCCWVSCSLCMKYHIYLIIFKHKVELKILKFCHHGMRHETKMSY